MRAGLNEAVLLVNVQCTSIMWPVLYANEEWTTQTGIRVTPPTSFPGLTIAEGPGLPCVTKGLKTCKDPMIWQWLQLFPDDAEQLVDRLRDAWSRACPTMFNVNATMPVSDGGRVKVTCRFMPANKPL